MKAKPKLSADTIGAPSVRVARGEVELEQRNVLDDQGTVVGRRTGHAVGLRRYLARGEITSRQYEAGRLWAVDWEQSKAAGARAVDPGRVAGGGDQSAAVLLEAERALHASRRFDAGIRALGPLYACCADVVLANGAPQAWATRRRYKPDWGFAFLVLGLDSLAAQYELAE